MTVSTIVRRSFAAAILPALLTGCASNNLLSAPVAHSPESAAAHERVLPTQAARGAILVEPLPAGPALRRSARAGSTSERFARRRSGPHLLRYISIPGTTPFFITFGPRQAFWFTTGDQPGSIGRLIPGKPYTLFPLPPVGPYGAAVSLRIVTGPDGNLWITLDGGIAKMTPSGKATAYPISTPGADLGYIAVGSDGNLWFTEHFANQFARITPDGTITEFPFEDIGAPNGIVNGPDGRLWICEQGAYDANTGHQTYGRIERVNTDGTIDSTYNITPNNWQNVPEDITVGGDGKLWFTQFNAIQQTIYEISNITLNGTITQYDTPNTNAGPGSPILAGDGNVWFSEAYAAQLGRVTPAGHIKEFPLQQGSGNFPTAPYGLTKNGGKGLRIWFADYQNARLGEFSI
jgi:virginiamycin B lyase